MSMSSHQSNQNFLSQCTYSISSNKNYSSQAMNFISNNNNNNNYPNNSDNNYLKERYNKIKAENLELKRKLFEQERNYKLKKAEMEENILMLRDENSNLQLEIQKIIENHKNLYKNNDAFSNQNKILLSDVDKLKIEQNNYKETVNELEYQLIEKNQKLDDLLIEKSVLMDQQVLNETQIKDLTNDKNLLIQQINELNSTLINKISPKLKQHEENLESLQNQIEILKVENSKFKNDNTMLFNDNKMQKNIINVLTKQNKKLLNEIKIINDRDISLMENMEKIGISKKEKKNLSKINNNIVNNIPKKNNNKINQKLFEEELDILKNTEKYLNNFNNEQNIEDDEEIFSNINNKNDININENKQKNKNLVIDINENNSLYKKIISRNNTNNNTTKKQQKTNQNYKNIKGIRDISATAETCRTEGTTTVNDKIKKDNKNFITMKNGIDDIFNNNIDINKKEGNNSMKEFLIKTDNILNKNNKNLSFKENKNYRNTYQKDILTKNELGNYFDDKDGNIANTERDIYNVSDNSEDKEKEGRFNSQSQGKSLLSEYVEDLDVIQYKEENDENADSN